MKTKLLSLLALSFLVVVLPGCWGDGKNAGCCPCDSHTQQTVVAEVVPGVVVVNVLDKDHFDDCRIKGSINVPFESFGDFAQELEQAYPVKSDVDVVVYCSNYFCSASGEAAKMLVAKGFTNVSAYEAGMAEWFQESLPVEGSCQKPYLAKKMSAPQTTDAHDYAVITTRELAQKLGLENASQPLNELEVELVQEDIK